MHLIHVKICTPPLKGYKKVLCLRNIMWTISLEVGKSISLWSKKWIETRKLHSYLYGGIISRLFTYIICTQSSLLESDFWNQKALLMLICFFWACLFSRNCTCCEFPRGNISHGNQLDWYVYIRIFYRKCNPHTVAVCCVDELNSSTK
jgi:hypothetical protein